MPSRLSMGPRLPSYSSEVRTLHEVFRPPPPSPITREAMLAESMECAAANSSRARVTSTAETSSTSLLPKRSISGPTATVAKQTPANNSRNRSPCWARFTPSRSRMAGRPNRVPSSASTTPKMNMPAQAAANNRARCRPFSMITVSATARRPHRPGGCYPRECPARWGRQTPEVSGRAGEFAGNLGHQSHGDGNDSHGGTSCHRRLPALDVYQRVLGRHAVINHQFDYFTELRAAGVGGRALPLVVHGCHRYGAQPATGGFHGHLDHYGVKAAMGEDQHDIAGADGLVFEQQRRIAFPALQPKQPLRAARAQHVGPHQARVHERTKSGKAAITGKDVEYGDHGVSAAEQVDQAAAGNRFRHGCSGTGDAFGLRVPDLVQNFRDAVAILVETHNVYD